MNFKMNGKNEKVLHILFFGGVLFQSHVMRTKLYFKNVMYFLKNPYHNLSIYLSIWIRSYLSIYITFSLALPSLSLSLPLSPSLSFLLSLALSLSLSLSLYIYEIYVSIYLSMFLIILFCLYLFWTSITHPSVSFNLSNSDESNHRSIDLSI